MNFECRLIRAIRVADNIAFFGRVVRLHIRDDVLTQGLVDVRKVNAIGRLGGRRYSRARRLRNDAAASHRTEKRTAHGCAVNEFRSLAIGPFNVNDSR